MSLHRVVPSIMARGRSAFFGDFATVLKQLWHAALDTVTSRQEVIFSLCPPVAKYRSTHYVIVALNHDT